MSNQHARSALDQFQKHPLVTETQKHGKIGLRLKEHQSYNLIFQNILMEGKMSDTFADNVDVYVNVSAGRTL